MRVTTSALVMSVVVAMTAGPASAGLITFDDIPMGRIEDQYFDLGLMFFVGNGEYGTSTDLLYQDGKPVTAFVGNFGTSLTQPHIMNPGGGPGIPGNSDIIIHFFDEVGERTFASMVGIFNDLDGNPSTIYIEGFDIMGASLGRTQINGGGAGGTFSSDEIYSASIYAEFGQIGLIGVDNFSYTLVPAPGALGLLSLMGIYRWRSRRRAT